MKQPKNRDSKLDKRRNVKAQNSVHKEKHRVKKEKHRIVKHASEETAEQGKV